MRDTVLEHAELTQGNKMLHNSSKISKKTTVHITHSYFLHHQSHIKLQIHDSNIIFVKIISPIAKRKHLGHTPIDLCTKIDDLRTEL